MLSDSLSLIQGRVDALTPDARANLDSEMAVSFEEHFRYQQLQAEEHASGRISTEDALLIYAALGEVGSAENGGWASGTDLATKVLVTLAVGNLLDEAVRRRRAARQ